MTISTSREEKPKQKPKISRTKRFLEGVGLLGLLIGVVALVALLTIDDQLCNQAELALEKILPEYRVTIGSASRVDGRGLLFRDVRFYLRSEQPKDEQASSPVTPSPNSSTTDSTNSAPTGKNNNSNNNDNGESESNGTSANNAPPLSILSRLTLRNRRLVHPILEVEQLQLSCPTDWESLLQKPLEIREIYLQRPVLRKRTLIDGRDSLTALLTSVKPQSESTGVLQSLERIRIEQGAVECYEPRFRMSDPSTEQLPAPLWTLTGLSADLTRDFAIHADPLSTTTTANIPTLANSLVSSIAATSSTSSAQTLSPITASAISTTSQNSPLIPTSYSALYTQCTQSDSLTPSQSSSPSNVSLATSQPTPSQSPTPQPPAPQSLSSSSQSSGSVSTVRSPFSDRWNIVVRFGTDFLRSATLELQLDPEHNTASLRGEFVSLDLTEDLFVACGISSTTRQYLANTLAGTCDLRVNATLPADGSLDWSIDVGFQGFYRHPDYAQPFDRIDLSGSLTPNKFRLHHLQTQWGAAFLSCDGETEIRPSVLRSFILTLIPSVPEDSEILPHPDDSDPTNLTQELPPVGERFVLPEVIVLSEVVTKAEQSLETAPTLPETTNESAPSQNSTQITPPAQITSSAPASPTSPSYMEVLSRIFPNGQLRFQTKQLALLPELRTQLPEHQRPLWDQYAPEGTIDVDGVLEGKDGQWNPRLTATFHDFAFRYPKFPYRLQRGNGMATLTSSELSLNLTMFADTRPVQIEGTLANPLTAPTGTLHVTAQQIQIEDSLIQAIPDPAGQTIRQMGLRGAFDVDATMTLPGVGQPLKTQMSFSSKNLQLCYAKFPYEIGHITLAATYKDRVWQIEGAGFHGSQPITGRMKITPEPERRYRTNMELFGEQIALDEALRSSLPETPRQIWDNLSPRGRANVQIQMVYLSGTGKPDLQIIASNWSEDTSLEPAIFRYRLERVQGLFVYRNESVTFQNFSAMRDSTHVRCDTEVFLYPDRSWSFTTKNLQVERLCFDESLIQALPPAIRSTISTLRPTGTFLLRSGPDGVSFLHRPQNSGQTPWVARWDLLIDSQGNKLNSGIPLENIYGTVRLVGSATPENHLTRGELRLDSLMVQKVQLSNVRGPFSIENGQFCFGNSAVIAAIPLSDGTISQSVAIPGGLPTLNTTNGLIPNTSGLSQNTAGLVPRTTEIPGTANIPGISGPSTPNSTGVPTNTTEFIPSTRKLLPPVPAAFSTSEPTETDAPTTTAIPAYTSQTSTVWSVPLTMETTVQSPPPVSISLPASGDSTSNGISSNGTTTHGASPNDPTSVVNLPTPPIGPTPSTSYIPTLSGNPAFVSQIRPVSAILAEGVVELSGQVLLSQTPTYQFAVSISNANLATLIGNRQPGRQSVSGRLSLNGTFAGSGYTAANLGGRGQLHLDNADIQSIPVVFSVVQTNSGTREQRTFRSVDVNFELAHSRILMDRIELRGDSICFLGQGEWTLPSQINLSFYSLLGRPDRQIPLLSQLLGDASRGLMEIRVNGTIDHPEIETQAFPAVAAIIEQFTSRP